MHVELLNGESAELRDAETITRLQRRELLSEIREKATPDDMGAAATDALFAYLIVSWTLSLPLPSQERGSVDKLLAMDETTLDQAASEIMKQLIPQTNFEMSTDPDSPSKPSNG